jgi:hypothetical protein
MRSIGEKYVAGENSINGIRLRCAIHSANGANSIFEVVGCVERRHSASGLNVGMPMVIEVNILHEETGFQKKPSMNFVGQ